MKLRRHPVKSFAILLLIVATLSLQAAPLTPHHSNDDVTHGCVFCHFAHLAWANPAEALGVLAPVAADCCCHGIIYDPRHPKVFGRFELQSDDSAHLRLAPPHSVRPL